jgi:serine/threonine-protein kinase
VSEQQFGPYRLVSLLGQGGMGEVWRAVDVAKNREVAIKVLGSWVNGDPDFERRFRRESERAARLNSPNIIPIHDYGEIDGRLFIVMPLVSGTDLAELLRHGPLEPERAVRIIAQAGRALSDAHRAGLVHRDVKPSNILVTTDYGEDHVYLIDFGIARAADGTRSMSGRLVGSPPYMAPERFAGEGDHRTDIYALGCVLHEALTGQPAFTAPNLLVYVGMHLNTPPPRPSEVRPQVPVALDDVVTRALAKDPDERFAEVADFVAAARAAINQPATARQPIVEPPVDEVPDDRQPAPRTPDTLSWRSAPRTSSSPAPVPPLPGAVRPPARRRSRRLWPIATVVVAAVLAFVLPVVWGILNPSPGGGQAQPMTPPASPIPETSAIRTTEPVVVPPTTDPNQVILPTFPATPTGGVAAPGQPGAGGSGEAMVAAPLRVYNNSTITGLADVAAEDFRNAGFTVDEVGNFPSGVVAETTVYYRPGTGEQETAEALGERFGLRVHERFPGLADASPGVIVVINRDYAG